MDDENDLCCYCMDILCIPLHAVTITSISLLEAAGGGGGRAPPPAPFGIRLHHVISPIFLYLMSWLPYSTARFHTYCTYLLYIPTLHTYSTYLLYIPVVEGHRLHFCLPGLFLRLGRTPPDLTPPWSGRLD
jgi:hypothetical protein